MTSKRYKDSLFYTDLEQNTVEWLELRKQCICTASKASNLLTPAKLQIGVEAERMIKRRALKSFSQITYPDIEKTFKTPQMEYGTEYEPFAKEMLEKLLGVEINTIGFITTVDGLWGCSPDGVSFADKTNPFGVEIKCPEPLTHLHNLEKNKIPEDYEMQIHFSMAISQIKTWHYFEWCEGMKPLHIIVRWNEKTDKICNAIAELSARYMATVEKIKEYVV
jgi:exodeoxyribonuclease (lambda-induced)